MTNKAALEALDAIPNSIRVQIKGLDIIRAALSPADAAERDECARYLDGVVYHLRTAYGKVLGGDADWIERAARLLRSPAPSPAAVAWQWRYLGFQEWNLSEERPLKTDPIEVRALYAAPPAQEGAREGWKLVPVEPTYDMVRAAQRAFSAGCMDIGIYRAMLAAAPTSPTGGTEGGG